LQTTIAAAAQKILFSTPDCNFYLYLMLLCSSLYCIAYQEMQKHHTVGQIFTAKTQVYASKLHSLGSEPQPSFSFSPVHTPPLYLLHLRLITHQSASLGKTARTYSDLAHLW
jgi:hypothetical protein